ncbi:phosphotransferase [Mycolicibacterium vaccae]|uniref:phosphotransferase n=1 Tax=Mycolicibacterium vaccae TaxID=1810 RepID=UPI003CF94B2D
MATPMTAGQLADRTRRAAAAALRAAKEPGVHADRATVLHAAFSVVAHLKPAPVVARIPVVLTSGTDPAQQNLRRQRELDVAHWLDGQRVPVVRPAPGIPRAPVHRDGFDMTFWELADTADDHVPYHGVDLSYSAELHAVLAGYPEPLPFLAPFNQGLPELLDRLEPGPLLTGTDIDRAHREFGALRAVLADEQSFHTAFPGVPVGPIQGDVPSHNVIRTRTGILFSDFEDACTGPVEWDVAVLGPDATAEYDAAARARGLRAVDPAVARLVDRARQLQFVGCVALVDELPLLATGLAEAVEDWRGTEEWVGQAGS